MMPCSFLRTCRVNHLTDNKHGLWGTSAQSIKWNEVLQRCKKDIYKMKSSEIEEFCSEIEEFFNKNMDTELIDEQPSICYGISGT